MRLQLLDPAFAVQVVLGICGVLFALCVLATMYALFTIFERTKALVPEDGDRHLKWGERKAREFDRGWRGFMPPRGEAPPPVVVRRLFTGVHYRRVHAFAHCHFRNTSTDITSLSPREHGSLVFRETIFDRYFTNFDQR